jgi:hypothetical protein
MGCMPLQQYSLTVDEGILDYQDTLHRCVKRSMLNHLYHLALAQQDAIATALYNGGCDETSAPTLALVHRVNQKIPLRSIWNEVLSASTITFSGPWNNLRFWPIHSGNKPSNTRALFRYSCHISKAKFGVIKSSTEKFDVIINCYASKLLIKAEVLLTFVFLSHQLL